MNPMKRAVLIRADGAKHLGMGHIVRCLNFAQTLKIHGIESIFVTRDFEDTVVNRIKMDGFKVHTIIHNSSFREDAMMTGQLAESSSVLCVIVDLSSEENLAQREKFVEYFKMLKTENMSLVAFDDFKKIDFSFNLQVIPYYGAQDIDYRFFDKTKYLLGCSYYIADPGLVEKVKFPREIKEKARKILVTIGGTDLHNLSVDVAQSLANLDVPDLEVKFILGTCFEEGIKTQINNILRNFQGSCELCYNNQIPDLMLWSDLVITGVGLTRYEAALTGTPNICVTREDLKIFQYDRFVTSGTSIHLTIPDSTYSHRITEKMQQLLNNFDARKRMHETGKKLIDGKGAERIIAELEERIFSLR